MKPGALGLDSEQREKQMTMLRTLHTLSVLSLPVSIGVSTLRDGDRKLVLHDVASPELFHISQDRNEKKICLTNLRNKFGK